VSMMTGADHDHEVIVSVIILTNIDEWMYDAYMMSLQLDMEPCDDNNA
jgi:hypothetical protein